MSVWQVGRFVRLAVLVWLGECGPRQVVYRFPVGSDGLNLGGVSGAGGRLDGAH